MLKLRPIEGSGSAAADGAVLYLRLTVTMRGSQRLLLFRSLPEGGLPLPYRVSNSSAALLAFRQLGCPHWDLLGGGEACEYLWDDPTATRALELRSRDPSGSFYSAASSVALEKADARPTALELMTKGQFAEGVAKARLGSPPADEATLMSVSATLRYGAAPAQCAQGWLCLTQEHLSFVFFSYDAEERRSLMARARRPPASGCPAAAAVAARRGGGGGGVGAARRGRGEGQARLPLALLRPSGARGDPGPAAGGAGVVAGGAAGAASPRPLK